MAAWLDLAKHLEDGLYLDGRLHTECVYKSDGVPAWLSVPLQTAVKSSEGLTPVLVVNAKGRKVPDALCVLRLEDLEALLCQE